MNKQFSENSINSSKLIKILYTGTCTKTTKNVCTVYMYSVCGCFSVILFHTYRLHRRIINLLQQVHVHVYSRY